MASTLPYYCTLECVHINFNQQGKEKKLLTGKNDNFLYSFDAGFTNTKRSEITNCGDIIFIK